MNHWASILFVVLFALAFGGWVGLRTHQNQVDDKREFDMDVDWNFTVFSTTVAVLVGAITGLADVGVYTLIKPYITGVL